MTRGTPASRAMTWRDDERESSRPSDPARSPGATPKNAGPGYQSASEELATSAQVSGPPSPRELKERVKKQREPGIWLPGADELDGEAVSGEDRETRFSGDSYGGRGNPQVSVRLRPRPSTSHSRVSSRDCFEITCVSIHSPLTNGGEPRRERGGGS